MNVQLVVYTNQKEILCKLIQGFWKSHNDYDQPIEETLEDLQEWTKKGHQMYLIQYEMNYVGFVHLGSRGCEIDWLEDIFVLDEYQGKGIGTYTISLVEDIVKKYSDSLYIEAAARNQRAIQLYQRLGYNCLNTITVRKDFHPEKTETIRNEKIYDLDFEIRKYKQ
ncbi:MAG: GNAT family N-acetyltransferase [Traorella sp.]